MMKETARRPLIPFHTPTVQMSLNFKIGIISMEINFMSLNFPNKYSLGVAIAPNKIHTKRILKF